MTIGLAAAARHAAARRAELPDPLEERPRARTGESALFYAYSRTRPAMGELRDCACGSQVEADPDAPLEGVQAHNRSIGHAAWATAAGMRHA